MTTNDTPSTDVPDSENGTTTGTQRITCSNCGASLTFTPGTTHLSCRYCGTENEIAVSTPETIVENDYVSFLEGARNEPGNCEELHTVTCKSCGAATTLKPNVTSDTCPFCGTPLIVQNAQTLSVIKPRYLLPFKIERQQAHTAFRTWIAKQWFAPNDLKRHADTADKINGLYIPYWTYDSSTTSGYTGRRGTNHMQSYTAVVNGRRVTRTRTVIHWSPVSGQVHTSFDDVLIVATTSLPEKYAAKLEPWDLNSLVDFNESFLAGFRTETYRVDVKEGFERAKAVMDKTIREAIRRDIGGDHQQISTVNTSYDNITFKHLLLPIWISAYRYRGKVYRFMVNGRTGEVQGERPWSVVKITLAIAGGLAMLAGAWFLLQPYMQ